MFSWEQRRNNVTPNATGWEMAIKFKRQHKVKWRSVVERNVKVNLAVFYLKYRPRGLFCNTERVA